MATSLTRAAVKRYDDHTVIRNKTHIILAAATAAALLLGTFIDGAQYQQHPDDADFIGLPIISMIMLYMFWALSMRLSVRLRPEGIVIENGCLRHEIPWLQRGDFSIGEFRSRNDGGGLQMNLYSQKITAAAFNGNLIASSMGYPGLHAILDLINQEIAHIAQDQTSHSPPLRYQSRLQVPDAWVLPAAAIAAEACFSLGILIGGH